MEDYSQLDPQYNYADDILQNHPALVAKDKGNVDWNGMQKLFMPKTQELSGEHYTSPGVKSSNDFKATYMDGLQTLSRDPKGVYDVSTLSDPIITKDANGNPIKIDALPRSTLNTMQKTPGAKANMDVATQRWLAQTAPDKPQPAPGTEDFENAKAIMAYQMMKGFSAKSISDKQKVNTAPIVIRQQLGYPPPGTKTTDTGDNNANISASFKDITGAPFSGVGSAKGITGSIVNGKFQPTKKGLFSPMFNSSPQYNGQEMTGEIPIDKLPASVYKSLTDYLPKADIPGEVKVDDNGHPILDDKGKTQPTGYVKVKIGADGSIIAVDTDRGLFTVPDRTNANIKLQNSTTTMKRKQHYNLPDANSKKTAADYGLN
jgi:hypothetical protein